MKKMIGVIFFTIVTSLVYAQECSDEVRARMIKNGISDEVIQKECGPQKNESKDEKKISTQISEKVSKKRQQRSRLAWTFRNCDLGGIIFDREPVFAAISNVTWDSGTSASSTSSSSPDACGGDERLAVLKYTNVNYVVLIEESSKGIEKHSTALAGLFNCNSIGQKNVSQQFREKYLDKYIDLENNLNNNSFELALDFYELSSNESNCNLVIN